MNAVSVVIPHWNHVDLLERVLRSVAAQTLVPAEVIVVDNGSTDNSVVCARRFGAQVLELGSNYGFSRAVNEGWKTAKFPWVLVLNNDVELTPDLLSKLIGGAAEWEASFAVPCLIDSREPNRIDGTFDLLSTGGTAWRAGNGQLFGGVWTKTGEAWFPPLTAALLRRDLLQQVGGLDERFESYLEDVDFGIRCALAGKTGVYVPDARAMHLGSATFGEWGSRKVRLISRNQVFLIAKHYPNWWFFRFGWQVLVAQFLWGLLALKKGEGAAWLSGKLSGIRSYRRIRRARTARACDNFSALLDRSESLLWALSQHTSDTYWRVYFRLIGRKGSRT